eukprot:gnl/TRDRNA2_/TRDRNA2_155478_c0_seq1.p2 gnl/TRDRNA2_/TRDRNA2_155478_c0~~gnl/TRDRNA2_/TRDRNA2_155478_c0_seq1.p2  ORF type:complete len:115 (+),score=28.36 gnl/TRDRNA2_/TRDRNA2_155478_c0_seq1:53-397(+)
MMLRHEEEDEEEAKAKKSKAGPISELIKAGAAKLRKRPKTAALEELLDIQQEQNLPAIWRFGALLAWTAPAAVVVAGFIHVCRRTGPVQRIIPGPSCEDDREYLKLSAGTAGQS